MLENQAAIEAHKANPRAMPAKSTERSGNTRRLRLRYTSSAGAPEEWYTALSLDSEVKLAKFCPLESFVKYQLRNARLTRQ